MFVLSLSLLSFTGLGTKNWVFKVQNPWQSAGYHSETEVNKVWMDKKKTVYQMRVVTVFSLKKLVPLLLLLRFFSVSIFSRNSTQWLGLVWIFFNLSQGSFFPHRTLEIRKTNVENKWNKNGLDWTEHHAEKTQAIEIQRQKKKFSEFITI